MSYQHVPVLLSVRRPPSVSVCGLWGVFKLSGSNVFKIMLGGEWVVSIWLSEVVGSGEICLYSGFGERDARPCVARVRLMLFERCPASALRCVGPGPLGDASGSFSLVVASVSGDSVWFSCCLLLTLWVAVVR